MSEGKNSTSTDSARSSSESILLQRLIVDRRVPVTARLLLLFAVEPGAATWSSRMLARKVGTTAEAVRISYSRLRERNQLGTQREHQPVPVKILLALAAAKDGLTKGELAERTGMSVDDCLYHIHKDPGLRRVIRWEGMKLVILSEEAS